MRGSSLSNPCPPRKPSSGQPNAVSRDTIQNPIKCTGHPRGDTLSNNLVSNIGNDYERSNPSVVSILETARNLIARWSALLTTGPSHMRPATSSFRYTLMFGYCLTAALRFCTISGIRSASG